MYTNSLCRWVECSKYLRVRACVVYRDVWIKVIQDAKHEYLRTKRRSEQEMKKKCKSPHKCLPQSVQYAVLTYVTIKMLCIGVCICVCECVLISYAVFMCV